MRCGLSALRPILGLLLGSLLVVPAPCAGATGLEAANPEDCKALLPVGALNKIPDKYLLSPGLRREVQKGLDTVYSGNAAYERELKGTDLLSDSRIGSVTRNWLESLCVDFPVYGTAAQVPEAVMRSALHYAEIADKNPNWKQTLMSRELDKWVREAPAGGGPNFRQIRRSGSSMAVTALLAEFSAEQDSRAGKAKGAAKESSCGLLLQSGRENKIPGKYLSSLTIGRKVQKGLQAVYFDNPEYRTELEGTTLLSDGRIGSVTRKWLERLCQDVPVSGLPQNVPDRVVKSAIHYAEIAAARPEWREVISDPGFNDWVRDPTPEATQEHRPLRLSGSAPVVIELIAAYPGTAAPLPRLLDACAPASTGAAIYYELTGADLEHLNARKDFLDQARKLVGKRFNSEVELEEAIGPAAALLKSECVRDTFLSAVRDNKRAETIGYRLTEQSFQHLREELKPPAGVVDESDILFAEDIISALGTLENEVYGRLDGLAQSIRFTLTAALSANDTSAKDSASPPEQKPASRKMEALIDLVVDQVTKTAEPVAPYLIKPEVIDELSRDPLFVAVPEPLVARLGSLVGVAYVDDRLFASAVRSKLLEKNPAGNSQKDSGPDDTPQTRDAGSVRAIIAQARKQGQAKPPLRIRAENCGCARQWDSVGNNRFSVYGFFPFWMSAASTGTQNAASAGAEEKQPSKEDGRAVDFGVLSRIGYFALELDDKGSITTRRLWTAEEGAKPFLAEAHRYRTKVDLVIEAGDWQRWDKGALQRSADSIWGLIDPSRVSPSMLPDGIAIYFPSFPEYIGKRDTIIELVKGLRKQTEEHGGGRELSLSIIVDSGNLDLDNAIHSSSGSRFLGALEEILVGNGGRPAMVDLVMVFLPQPITDMKKRLRLAVENEFSGQARTNVLRKILPVVAPNGHRGKAEMPTECYGQPGTNDPYWQLQNDLTYFRDNFRGVAFWPLLTAATAQANNLDKRLSCTFAKSETAGVATQVLETLAPRLCVYVCPNRDLLWYVAGALAGLLILLALLASLSCQLRSAIAKRFLYPLAGLLLLIMIVVPLITCDPSLNQQEPLILMTLVGLLLASWLIHYIRAVKRGPLP